MKKKQRCLVYLGENFQDLEFVAALASMKKSGLFELDFRGNLEQARELSGQYGFVKVLVKPIETKELEGFDSLFITGGAHCKGLRTDPLFKEVATFFFEKDLAIYAICDGPNVLYEFGLIGEEEAYTSYPLVDLKAGRGRRGQEAVVWQPGSRLVTARDPASAFDFGLAILESLK